MLTQVQRNVYMSGDFITCMLSWCLNSSIIELKENSIKT